MTRMDTPTLPPIFLIGNPRRSSDRSVAGDISDAWNEHILGVEQVAFSIWQAPWKAASTDWLDDVLYVFPTMPIDRPTPVREATPLGRSIPRKVLDSPEPDSVHRWLLGKLPIDKRFAWTENATSLNRVWSRAAARTLLMMGARHTALRERVLAALKDEPLPE